METVSLDPESLDSRTRAEWESKRLIKSLTDTETRTLVLGVQSANSKELAAAVAEKQLDLKQRFGDLCWISLVGEAEALRERVPKDLDLLSREGIEVMFHEAATIRNTYIVSAEYKARAVEVLYRGSFA